MSCRLKLIPFVVGVLFLFGCGESRRVEVPRTFLDSLTLPVDSTNLMPQISLTRDFLITRDDNESVALVIPGSETKQSTGLYRHAYVGRIEDNTNIIALKSCGPQGEMIYELDTLPDGRYFMSAAGDGYSGDFFLTIITQK